MNASFANWKLNWNMILLSRTLTILYVNNNYLISPIWAWHIIKFFVFDFQLSAFWLLTTYNKLQWTQTYNRVNLYSFTHRMYFIVSYEWVDLPLSNDKMSIEKVIGHKYNRLIGLTRQMINDIFLTKNMVTLFVGFQKKIVVINS